VQPSEQNTNDSTLPPVPVAIPIAPPHTQAGLPESTREFDYVDDQDYDFRPRDLPRAQRRGPRKIAKYVRILLVLMAVGFVAVLGAAIYIRPYDADGQPFKMGTHQQLGMQPCNMVVLTGKPCPACGMTTSFALLMHGDVVNSMRANWVGTLFCASIVVLIPWAVAGAYRGRLLWVRNGELFATILLSSLLILMMARWVWVLIQ
jgi:hypothetical protein